MKHSLLFCIIIFLIVIGCKKNDDQTFRKSSDNIGSKGMLINNNLNTLNERISLTDNTPAYVFGDTKKNNKK